MGENLGQNVRDLLARVESLETRLDREVKLRDREKQLANYRYRKFRAAIVRLRTGESGELWQIGSAYSRGSLCRVPRKPDFMDVRTHRRPIGDGLWDRELGNVSRNGLPTEL